MKTLLIFSMMAMTIGFLGCKKDDGVRPSSPASTNPPVQNPIGFKVKRIEVQNVPQCWLSGAPIDGQYTGDRPDIQARLMITGSNQSLVTGTINDAAQAVFNGLSWTVMGMTQSAAVHILDIDNLGPVTASETMAIIPINGNLLLNDPDNVYSVRIDGSFSNACYPFGNPSWVRITFEILY